MKFQRSFALRCNARYELYNIIVQNSNQIVKKNHEKYCNYCNFSTFRLVNAGADSLSIQTETFEILI